MKKFFSILLALAMVLSVLGVAAPQVAYAETEDQDEENPTGLYAYVKDPEGETGAFYEVLKGGSVTLEVVAGSNGEGATLHYTWEKYDYDPELSEGDPYVFDDSFTAADAPSLEVSGVEMRQQYACTVTDDSSYATVWFEITVDNQFNAYVKGTDELVDTDISLEPGETTALEVEASAAEGDIHYSWYCNEEKMDADTASITVVDKTANYRCAVSDDYGNTLDVLFYVSVNSGLTAFAMGTEEEYATVTVKRGESATFEVEATGEGPITYQWYDDDYEPITGATASSYTLENIQENVRYTCYVTDKYGTLAPVYFDVEIENGLYAYVSGTETQYGEVKVKKGETAELKVDAGADIEPIYYFWYTDDSEEEQGTLVYTTAPVDAPVNYYCRVEDEFGNFETVEFTVSVDTGLTVTPKASVEYEYEESDNYVVVYGLKDGKVELSVEAKNDGSAPITYHWNVYYGAGSIEGEQTGASAVYVADSYKSGAVICVVSDGLSAPVEMSFAMIPSGLKIEDSNGFMFTDAEEKYVPVESGSDARLWVKASVEQGKIVYTWYNIDDEGNHIVIEGATSDSYTLSNVKEDAVLVLDVDDEYGERDMVYYAVFVGKTSYAWAEDNSSVTATFTPDTEAEGLKPITETVAPSKTETPATATEMGSVVYTATFENEVFKAQTKTVNTPATGEEPAADDNVTVTGTTDKDGKAVEASVDTAATPSAELTEEKAAEIIDAIVKANGTAATEDDIKTPDTVDDKNLAETRASQLKVIWTRDVTVPAGTVFPVTITFSVPEAADDQEVYVYHFSGSTWELVGTGKGKTVEATFDSLSPVAVVLKNAATSPQTADPDMSVWTVMLLAAAAVAVFTFAFTRKRREN